MRIDRISVRAFARFGKLIEYPRKSRAPRRGNLFHIVCRERKPVGWRIAFLVVRERQVRRMEQHPGVLESFEPVSGAALLLVSDRPSPQRIRCFRLDRPVVLHRDIWHAVVTVSKESQIKITEDARVRCRYWRLRSPLPER